MYLQVVFLNITSFRQGVLEDLPMLQLLENASEYVFVPLTVGGGIREYVDCEGKCWSALEVAARYFRAGADKISIGSDAVYAAESFLSTGQSNGISSLEQISKHYGAQAVVVSIDPRRVYVHSPDDVPDNDHPDPLRRKTVVALRETERGPSGEGFCWWQVTVRGGRETRDLDAVQLARACELLGAGEIMLNCIDMDGQGRGYDLSLISAVQSAVRLPVIASSGAGHAKHFVDVFEQTDVSAALAAGIFHRKEVSISEVKQALKNANIVHRPIQ
jgi:imidazole glycerol-phosphate synthase